MLKNDVTLKPGLEVVQGHWKWYRSIDCIRVPIVVFSNIIILLEVNWFKMVWNCQNSYYCRCFLFSFDSFISILPRKHRGLCCHVVYVCLSVCLFVCLSVRPSVTFMDHVKTNKHIVTFFSLCGSSIILFFSVPNGMAIFQREPPNGGVECKGGMIKWRFFHKYLAVSQKR